jgi:hypothetical protein
MIEAADCAELIAGWREFAARDHSNAERYRRLAAQLQAMMDAGTVSYSGGVTMPVGDWGREAAVRQCHGCGRFLPVTAFTPAKRSPDGVNPRCRTCVKNCIGVSMNRQRMTTSQA